MRKIDTLLAARATARRRVAHACVERLLQDAAGAGIPITLVGSLARDTFRHHSDIDLLVRGPLSASARAGVERLVAHHLRESKIPYDLVFEADIGSDRAMELINGV